MKCCIDNVLKMYHDILIEKEKTKQLKIQLEIEQEKTERMHLELLANNLTDKNEKHDIDQTIILDKESKHTDTSTPDEHAQSCESQELQKMPKKSVLMHDMRGNVNTKNTKNTMLKNIFGLRHCLLCQYTKYIYENNNLFAVTNDTLIDIIIMSSNGYKKYDSTKGELGFNDILKYVRDPECTILVGGNDAPTYNAVSCFMYMYTNDAKLCAKVLSHPGYIALTDIEKRKLLEDTSEGLNPFTTNEISHFDEF